MPIATNFFPRSFYHRSEQNKSSKLVGHYPVRRICTLINTELFSFFCFFSFRGGRKKDTQRFNTKPDYSRVRRNAADGFLVERCRGRSVPKWTN